jgi:hypothetical protein
MRLDGQDGRSARAVDELPTESRSDGRSNSGCECVVSLKPSLGYLSCVNLIKCGYMLTGHESRLHYVVPR